MKHLVWFDLQPSLAIAADSAARDDDVNMRMEVLDVSWKSTMQTPGILKKFQQDG